MKKSGFAALIGRPNVGKSTLMNNIIGMKIAITSPKPQTTRNRIRTVYTEEKGQIVFLDTPGMHSAKNKLGDYMVAVAEHTLKDVDVILYLVEARDQIHPEDKKIIEKLKHTDTPVILIINKIDKIKKDEVLGVIAAYSKEHEFAEIVPVSALKGTNKEELINTIFEYLPEGMPFYDEDTVTDQPEKQIAAEMVRESALYLLSDEIPHGIAVAIDAMTETPKLVTIEATIICERDSHKGIIIGKGGSMLKQIGIRARGQIERMLGCHVNLKLFVKVKKDWRDSDYLVKNFGYDKKEL
ncbi:MAG: GTPase Era [Lachnospiraceae bacterium]|nr:GTPase Era [Lachnospiraceae bacterium]